MRNTIFAILAALALPVLPALAEQPGATYMHNGSVMRVFWSDEGDGMDIRYVQPRSSLGVSAGTTLFSGAMTASGRTYGRAYVFKSGCSAAEYEVNGNTQGDTLILKGKAPVFGDGCEVLGLRTTEHSTLRFTKVSD